MMVMMTIEGERDGELVVRTLVSRPTFVLEQCRFSTGPSEQRTLPALGCLTIPVSLLSCFVPHILCRAVRSRNAIPSRAPNDLDYALIDAVPLL